MAETSKRFHTIAKDFVPKVLTFGGFESYDVYRITFGKWSDSIRAAKSDLNRILNHFGEIVTLVDVVCGFSNFDLKADVQHLQKLHLYTVTVSEDTKIFAGMSSLVDLRISWVTNCHLILENTFPKLERFGYYVRTSGDKKLVELNSFFERHSKLKTIDVSYPSSDRDEATGNIFQTICRHCKNLEELMFACGMLGQSIFQDAQLLKSLRCLSVMREFLR